MLICDVHISRIKIKIICKSLFCLKIKSGKKKRDSYQTIAEENVFVSSILSKVRVYYFCLPTLCFSENRKPLHAIERN